MEFKDLSPEQRERVDACKNPQEILDLAKEEGYELSDAELDQVAGGWGTYGTKCPECGCRISLDKKESQGVTCPECNHYFYLLV